MAESKLSSFNILIVDGDIQLAKVLRSMLERMGFTTIKITANGREAFEALQAAPFDFMITEWNTREIDGLELLNRIRRDRSTPDQALPVIMLSGRGETADVITARDYGINEYVIKPFTAKTVYARLERLIEAPREFVLSRYFIGPTRRNKTLLPPKGTADRRKPAQQARVRPDGKNVVLSAESHTVVWQPDFRLKRKLGRETPLASVVTQTQLAEAQQAIEAATLQSMDWLQENLAELKRLRKKMKDGDFYTLLGVDLSETALTMSSRSGTFGFSSASKIAYMLYLFCRNHLRMEEEAHQLITEKHIIALGSALQHAQRENTTTQDHEIICELRNLVDKYVV